MATKKSQNLNPHNLMDAWNAAKNKEQMVEILKSPILTMEQCAQMLESQYQNYNTSLHPMVQNAVFENPNVKNWILTQPSNGQRDSGFLAKAAVYQSVSPLANWYFRYALDDNKMLLDFFDFIMDYHLKSTSNDHTEIWSLCVEKLSGWNKKERLFIATKKLTYVASSNFLMPIDQVRCACMFWDLSMKFLKKSNSNWIIQNMYKPMDIQDSWKPSFFNLIL